MDFKVSCLILTLLIGCKTIKQNSIPQQSVNSPTRKEPGTEDMFRAELPRTRILHVDYETGTLDSGVTNILVVPPQNPDAITISQSARFGHFAVKTTVGFSEDYVTAGKPRAETATMKIPESFYSAGEKWEYCFSLMLDHGWLIDPSGAAEIIWQFKRFDSGSLHINPDMFVAVKRGFIVLRSPGRQTSLVDLAKVVPGQWMDFRINVLWSHEPNGLTEVWFRPAAGADFAKVAVITGPNMGDDRPKSAYIKWGIYRPECLPSGGQPCSTADFSPRIVYHDEISAALISQ